MPRRKTTQTLKKGDSAEGQANSRSAVWAEATEAEKEAGRWLLMFQRAVRGVLRARTRGRFRDSLLSCLVHMPDERHAVTLLKLVRKKREMGKLRDLVGLVRWPGRRKGHTDEFWREAIAAFWADACGLSKKEILFYLGKIGSPSDSLKLARPMPNEYRDLHARLAVARKWILNPDEDEIPTLSQFALILKPMSKEERKTWAIALLKKVVTPR